MHARYVFIVTILLTIAGTGMTAGHGQSSNNTIHQPTAPAAQQACDYVSLYNKTIDSVVAVQRGGGEGSGFVYRTFESNNTRALSSLAPPRQAFGC